MEVVAAAGVAHRGVVAASEAVSAGVAAEVRAASEVAAVVDSGEEAVVDGTNCVQRSLR